MYLTQLNAESRLRNWQPVPLHSSIRPLTGLTALEKSIRLILSFCGAAQMQEREK
jgi:hypothetical protein